MRQLRTILTNYQDGDPLVVFRSSVGQDRVELRVGNRTIAVPLMDVLRVLVDLPSSHPVVARLIQELMPA